MEVLRSSAIFNIRKAIEYGAYSVSPRHSQWSLAQHPVNKPINMLVMKCINTYAKWDNEDYK